jgi:hypothetical protein
MFSLYVILSKAIYLSIVGRRSSNQDIIKKIKIIFLSSPALSSRSLSSQIPIQGVGPRLLEEKNSHGYPSQNSFFLEFSSIVGNVF